MMRSGWLAATVCMSLFLMCCSREVRLYSTWESLEQNPGKTRGVEPISLPPEEAIPWGGTVSHHLLADRQIDRWFAELAARRAVSRFYILCPSHWGLSTQTYSITDGSWRVKGGLVESDGPRARSLAKNLGVDLEPRVFDPEHGIATLIPYIAKYFPKAKIIAIAYRGEPPVNQPMAERLYECLSPAFKDKGRKKNFLLISTDFSHHGNLESTQEHDRRSEEFFRAPSVSSWIAVGCDNRPGIYVLSKFVKPSDKATILFHCNSLELSGFGDDDITSYFFSYFW